MYWHIVLCCSQTTALLWTYFEAHHAEEKRKLHAYAEGSSVCCGCHTGGLPSGWVLKRKWESPLTLTWKGYANLPNLEMVLDATVLKEKKIWEKRSVIKTINVANPACCLPDSILCFFLSTDVPISWPCDWMWAEIWHAIFRLTHTSHHMLAWVFLLLPGICRICRSKARWTYEPENSWSLVWEQGLSRLYYRMLLTWTYCLNCLSLGFVSTVISNTVCYTTINLQCWLKVHYTFKCLISVYSRTQGNKQSLSFCFLCFVLFFPRSLTNIRCH